MPNPHFDVQVISRRNSAKRGQQDFATDHSVVAAAAYIGRTILRDQRQGTWFDYRHAPGEVLHRAIMLPKDRPAEFETPQGLTRAMEGCEKRADARVGRRIIMGLPHELTTEQQIALTRDFIRETFTAQGMAAIYAVHGPHEEQDQRHVHAHILLSTRKVTATGFASKKTRAWNSKAALTGWRTSWAEVQNRHYRELGLPFEINPKTLKDVSRDRAMTQTGFMPPPQEPEIHVGKHEWLTGRGRDSENRRIVRRNAERQAEFADELREFAAVLSVVERQYPDVARALHDPKVEGIAKSAVWERIIEPLSGPAKRALAELRPVANPQRSALEANPFKPPLQLVSNYDIARATTGVDRHLTLSEQVRMAANFAQVYSDRTAGRDMEQRHRLLELLNRPIREKASERGRQSRGRERGLFRVWVNPQRQKKR